MSNYSELLKDPRWQKKRLEIMQRDNFTCQFCFSATKTLHVHHLAYEGSHPWETPNDKLVTVCERCHEEVEEVKKQYPVFAQVKLNLLKVFIYYEMGRDEEFFETLLQIYKIKKSYEDKREQGKILQEDSKEYLI